MLIDKTGRRVKTGDLILFDDNFMPGLVLRVRYQRKYNRGWMGDKLSPLDPDPQRIGGLGHLFAVIEKPQGVMQGVLCTDGWAGRREYRVELVKETPKKYYVRLLEAALVPGRGQYEAGDIVTVPKTAVRWGA